MQVQQQLLSQIKRTKQDKSTTKPKATDYEDFTQVELDFKSKVQEIGDAKAAAVSSLKDEQRTQMPECNQCSYILEQPTQVVINRALEIHKQFYLTADNWGRCTHLESFIERQNERRSVCTCTCGSSDYLRSPLPCFEPDRLRLGSTAANTHHVIIIVYVNS